MRRVEVWRQCQRALDVDEGALLQRNVSRLVVKQPLTERAAEFGVRRSKLRVVFDGALEEGDRLLIVLVVLSRGMEAPAQVQVVRG